MSDKVVTLPTADCDTADVVAPAPAPIQLCTFGHPSSKSPAWTLYRILDYTKDPEAYLKRTIGESTFASHRPHLSLPTTIDRDIYGTGAHKQAFESHIATLLSKSHGLFFITGVQAQLAAIKIHCDRASNPRAAWHVTSHLESAEERSYSHLYSLERTLLGSDPRSNPSVEDVRSLLSLPEGQRPAVILLELPNRTLGCATLSWEDLERISTACKEAGVKLHLDGARLWEIEPYYLATAGKSFADIVGLFDSVYVSFYKGMQGVGGAVLASNDEGLMNEAKVWQRRAGGNVYTLFPQVVDCERGFNENFGTFGRRREKMVEVAREVLKATERFEKEGRRVVRFSPEVPTCCQVHTVIEGYAAEELEKARDAVQEKTGIRVFERLRPKVSVDVAMRKEREGKKGGDQVVKEDGPVDDKVHFMEWMITAVTENIDTDVFVKGYVALCEELQESAAS